MSGTTKTVDAERYYQAIDRHVVHVREILVDVIADAVEHVPEELNDERYRLLRSLFTVGPARYYAFIPSSCFMETLREDLGPVWGEKDCNYIIAEYNQDRHGIERNSERRETWVDNWMNQLENSVKSGELSEENLLKGYAILIRQHLDITAAIIILRYMDRDSADFCKYIEKYYLCKSSKEFKDNLEEVNVIINRVVSHRTAFDASHFTSDVLVRILKQSKSAMECIHFSDNELEEKLQRYIKNVNDEIEEFRSN